MFETLTSAGIPVHQVENQYGRNTVSALIALNVITVKNNLVSRVEYSDEPILNIIKSAALNTPTVKFVSAKLLGNPEMMGREIGDELANHLNTTWSEASRLRYGTALATWARWANSLPGKRGNGKKSASSPELDLTREIVTSPSPS
ncbi:hypothetical protein [Sphingobium sp. D43FB]|uniref:hypothetical protein n=1 Tax=Sphingobium sp. D43FB TaxID=2017595 RepID=UPI0011435901|nr:hypothetical protein [Sphingobium sp. D43FB]